MIYVFFDFFSEKKLYMFSIHFNVFGIGPVLFWWYINFCLNTFEFTDNLVNYNEFKYEPRIGTLKTRRKKIY